MWNEVLTTLKEFANLNKEVHQTNNERRAFEVTKGLSMISIHVHEATWLTWYYEDSKEETKLHWFSIYTYIVYHFSQGQCLGLIVVGGLERGDRRSGFLSSAIIWKGSNWWYALVMVSWLLLYTAINHKTAIQILDHICWKKNVDRYDSPPKSCPVLHEKKMVHIFEVYIFHFCWAWLMSAMNFAYISTMLNKHLKSQNYTFTLETIRYF